ncbi:MAG: FAD-binding oxidoreductase, partial [Pseudomonadota bacterium]
MAWRTEIYSGWGRALSATGDVARPERASALETLPAAPARGQGRSYGDACLNDAGRIIDMSRLDRILGFEGGLLHVEAGARLGEIARIFAPQGWLPPVMPGTGFATVGGAIANDVHGKNHHHAGTFGQHVSEITLRFQGKTKRLRPENPLFKATIGGLGQTGTIVAAKLKMTAIAGQAMQVRERRMAGWEEFVAELSSSLAPYSVGWIDATARGAALGRGILEEGEIAQASAPGAKKAKKAKKIPFNAPSIALAPPIVRAFNAAYLRRVPASGRTVMRA